ncbi:protein of unknown function [Methanocaldococcus lauensis]|uniref:Uncharacterized protein n=1 Tax=Methanocaldococcus lauensis TaxID=2546128 RepID=A0A8D6PVQ9_9EURY|nr:hypothetical protein [Methanocaldococcus lauensis]CAB3288220.1 protein of unknown function [Methanocaldococcus lauensis]
MKTFTITNVGDEIIDNTDSDLDFDYDYLFDFDNLPDIIDYYLDDIYDIPNPEDFPDLPNFNVYTGYLYFNLTIETFGYGLWRGSTLCTVPNYIMVFPAAWKMNNGLTYWGTDIQPNFANVTNSWIGFFGSTNRDLLAEWGYYDAQYIHILRDCALEWMNMMKKFGDEWAEHLFDDPKTLNVARMIEYARKLLNTLSNMSAKDMLNLLKQKIGEAYDYIKNHKKTLIGLAIAYAVEETSGYILGLLGLPEALIFVAVLIIASTFPGEKLVDRWDEWKKKHGDSLYSMAQFVAHYVNPWNKENLWRDWWDNVISGISSLVDWLKNALGLNPDNMSWEDLYNELSKYAYNSIVCEDVNEIAFMVRDCSYRVTSYDGWLFPKYHIYSAYNFKDPKYELRRLIPINGGEDYLLLPLDFDVDKLFNQPFTDLIVLKTWENDSNLLTEVILNNDNVTLYICSTFPSYIQMQLYGIPKIKLG